MPTITDPDLLNDSAVNTGSNEVFIDPALRTIRLNNGSNNLDETGVTGQALYSFLKEEWKDDTKGKNLIAYPFPLVAITPEQFEFRSGWQPANDSSRNLIRNAGWREFATNNTTLNREYIGTISLGSIDGDQSQTGGGDQDFAYYAFFDTSGAPVAGPFNFDFPGPVNQPVQTYDSSSYDYRTNILTMFIRQPGKTYDQQSTVQIGIPAGATLPYNTQRFPLQEAVDLNVTVSDATIVANEGAGEKYDSSDVNGPTIQYLSDSELSNTFGYTQDLVDGPHGFGIKISAEDGTGGSLSLQELYSWVQYKLRQEVNIEDSAGSTKVGKLQDRLLQFVGPTLETLNATNLDGGGTGTAIINFSNTDINNIGLRDNTETLRPFPILSSGTLSFSDEIVLDSANASYFVFFEYTKSTSVSDLTISGVGPSAGDPAVDSAEFSSSATELPLLAADDYFRVTGASDPNNNQVWQVSVYRDSSSFSAVTYDDLPAANEGPFAGTIREHPINSPGALLVDSAGTTTPNTGGITGTLTGGISSVAFSYDYTNNSQGGRPSGVNADTVNILIRAIGLDNGSFVELAGQTITDQAQTYSIISAIERNYDNPA